MLPTTVMRYAEFFSLVSSKIIVYSFVVHDFVMFRFSFFLLKTKFLSLPRYFFSLYIFSWLLFDFGYFCVCLRRNFIDLIWFFCCYIFARFSFCFNQVTTWKFVHSFILNSDVSSFFLPSTILFCVTRRGNAFHYIFLRTRILALIFPTFLVTLIASEATFYTLLITFRSFYVERVLFLILFYICLFSTSAVVFSIYANFILQLNVFVFAEFDWARLQIHANAFATFFLMLFATFFFFF